MATNAEMLASYREACTTLAEQREGLLKSLGAIRDRIEGKIKHAMKRPALDEAEINHRIEELEERRTTTSVSLQAEKKILYEISQLRAQKTTIAEYEAFRTELDNLKAQRDQMNEQFKATSDELRRTREYVRQLELLERLQSAHPGAHIDTTHLRMAEISIKSSVIPKIIGKKGQNLRDIEAEALVSIDVEQPPREKEKDGEEYDVTVRITGLEAGVYRAHELITAVVDEEEVKVTVSPGLFSFLLSKSGAVIKDIEAQCHVKLRIDRPPPTTTATTTTTSSSERSTAPVAVFIRGIPSSVASAKAVLEAYESSKAVVVVDGRTLPAVIGKAGANLKKLRDDTGAEVQVVRGDREDRDAEAALHIYGPQGAIRAAAAALRGLVETVKELEEVVEVPRDAVPWLVGTSGERITAFQKANDVYARVLRGEDVGAPTNPTVANVVLKGTTTALEKAVPAFRQLLHEYHRTNKILVVNSAQARSLIGPAGAAIKKLRTDTGAAVEVVEAGREFERDEKAEEEGRKRRSRAEELGLSAGQAAVTIRGEEANVTAAMSAITDLIRSYTEAKVRVSGPVISALVAGKGALISAIQKDTGAVVDIVRDEAAAKGRPTSSGTLVICGSASAVAAAEAKMRDLTDAHQERVIALPEAGLVGEIVGKNGATIKTLQEELHVEIDVDKATMSLSLVGSKAALDAAAARFHDMFERYSKEHATVFVDPRQIPSLIGKGGASIKALQEETGATLHTETGSGEIRISGPEAAVLAAKAKIADICKLDQASETFQVDPAALGPLIGKGGGNVRKLEEHYRVSIAVDTTTGVFTLRGEPENITAAKVAIRRQTREALKEELDVAVPQESIGGIVGAKGARVRHLELQTGASIDLPRDRTTKTVQVHLRGTPVAVQKAKAVLDAIIAGSAVRILARPSLAIDILSGADAVVLRAFEQQNVTVKVFNADDEPEGGLSEDEEPLLGLVVVSGKAAAVVDRTAAAIDKLLSVRLGKAYAVVDAPVEFVDEVASKGAKETVAPANLRAKFGVGAIADREAGAFILWGASSSVDAARSAVQAAAASFKARFATVTAEAWVIPSLIGKKGAGITSFESETGVKLQIDRDASAAGTSAIDTTPVEIRLSAGDATALRTATSKLHALIEGIQKRRQILVVPGNAFGLIIGRGGATIKKIQEESGASMDMDRDRGVVVLRGASEEIVAAGRAALEKVLEETDVKVRTATAADLAPLPSESITGLSMDDMRAIGGKLRSLGDELGVQISSSRDDGKITVTGRHDADVAYAIGRVHALLDDAKKPAAVEAPSSGLPAGIRAVPGMSMDEVMAALKKGKRSRRAKKKGDKEKSVAAGAGDDSGDEETAAVPVVAQAKSTSLSLPAGATADDLLHAALTSTGRAGAPVASVAIPKAASPKAIAPVAVPSKAVSAPATGLTAQAAAALALGSIPAPAMAAHRPAAAPIPAPVSVPSVSLPAPVSIPMINPVAAVPKAVPAGVSITMAPVGPPPAVHHSLAQAPAARGPPPGLGSRIAVQPVALQAPPAVAPSPSRPAWGSSAKPSTLFTAPATLPAPVLSTPTKAAPTSSVPAASPATQLTQLFANFGLPSTALSSVAPAPIVHEPVTHVPAPAPAWGLGASSHAPALPGSAAAAALAALNNPARGAPSSRGSGAPRGAPSQARPAATGSNPMYVTSSGVPVRLS